jgi:hypothetical protein
MTKCLLTKLTERNLLSLSQLQFDFHMILAEIPATNEMQHKVLQPSGKELGPTD